MTSSLTTHFPAPFLARCPFLNLPLYCFTTLETFFGAGDFCKSMRNSHVSKLDSVPVPLHESHAVYNMSVISQAYLVI